MATGKEAFESACQLGVGKGYNYRQMSQIFYGIDVALREIEVSGGGNIVISGTQPDGEEEGQIAFFQGVDGHYYEYIWVGGSWVNVKTQNDDVTTAGSAPFITISGTTIETQRDINHYLNDKIENLIVDPSGEPIDLAPFATIEYSDAEDAKLQAQIEALTPEPDLGPPTTVQRLYRFSRTTLNPGDMFGNTDNAELMTSLTFADKDATNQNKPVFSEGDEIEFGGWKYKVTSTGIEYVSGPGGTIDVGTRYAVTFTIYPTGLAKRVAAGEETQAQILATISGALETQSTIQTSIASGQTVQGNLTTQVSDFAVRIASGETIQEDLVPRVAATETTQTELVSRVASGETLQSQIVGRLDQLETTRGADKIYQVHSVTTELAVRNGELVFNNADATLVSFISLAPFDSNGNASPLVSVGDIVDVEVGGTTNRYQVAQGTTDAQSILCIYLSGDSTYAVDQTITIYIYPQNSGNLATTEYVDEQNEAQDARSIKLDIGENIVTTAFRLKAPNGNTLISAVTGSELNIYNLADPTSDKHAISRGYADGRYLPTNALDPYATEAYVDNAIDVNLDGVLPLTGGTLTGNLYLDDGSGLYSKEIIKSTRTTGYAFQVKQDSSDATAYIHTNGNALFATSQFTGDVTIGGNLKFINGGRINADGSNVVLSGRASLEIRSAADYPVVISSGSSYKKVFAIYGYNGDEDDNRGEVAYIKADGKAYFKKVYANDQELATKSYVDDEVAANGMRWQCATHHTAGDLVAGEFFVSSNGNIYLHPISYDGVDLSVGSTAVEVADMKQLGSIHNANGNSVYHITWDAIRYNNADNKYIRITKNATHLDNSTTQGEIYRLNIPGFTF